MKPPHLPLGKPRYSSSTRWRRVTTNNSAIPRHNRDILPLPHNELSSHCALYLELDHPQPRSGYKWLNSTRKRGRAIAGLARLIVRGHAWVGVRSSCDSHAFPSTRVTSGLPPLSATEAPPRCIAVLVLQPLSDIQPGQPGLRILTNAPISRHISTHEEGGNPHC